jgi:hypothetical protein
MRDHDKWIVEPFSDRVPRSVRARSERRRVFVREVPGEGIVIHDSNNGSQEFVAIPFDQWIVARQVENVL